jgi:hypothetical protein
VPKRAPLPKVFTYFDCTDYIDQDDANSEPRPLLTFAKWRKRDDAAAKLRWYSHLYLLIVYVLNHQRPNVHGGYFEGLLTQELIYRLAYEATVRAYGSEAALGTACQNKQIRMLVSPMLWGSRRSGSVAPPRPPGDKMRPTMQAAPPPSPPAGVEVPNLVDMPIAEARGRLAATPQLMLLEVTREAPDRAGMVLSQTPPPGTRVQQRMSIEVVVAK